MSNEKCCMTCKHRNKKRQNGEKFRCTRWSKWVYPIEKCASHDFEEIRNDRQRKAD